MVCIALLPAWHWTAAAQGTAQPSAAPFLPRALSPQTGSSHDAAPGDLVHIKVFQEDDLESTLRVSNDGSIVFPLVGSIMIGNRTPAEASTLIADALKKGYLRNPQVTLTVVDAFKFRFTIIGQVQKPGSYDMPDGDKLTLLQAIGMAGGYTKSADSTKVTLKRRRNSKEYIYKVNAREMAGGKTTIAFEVLPGDVITVGESWF